MNKTSGIGHFALIAGACLVALSFALLPVPTPARAAAGSEPVVLLPVADPLSAAPPPDPGTPSVSPEAVQALALRWIEVATVVVGALGGFAAFLWAKIAEVKATVTSHGEQLKQQQGQLNDHALVIPPPAPGSTVAKLLVIGLGAMGAMGGMSGCAGVKTNAKQDAAAVKAALADTDFTASASYDGVTVTGGRVNGRGAVNVDVDAKEVQRAIER